MSTNDKKDNDNNLFNTGDCMGFMRVTEKAMLKPAEERDLS